MTVLMGQAIRLRPAAESDTGAFGDILGHPAVARWWASPDEALDEQVRHVIEPPEGTSSFAIDLADTTVGIILCSEELDPQYRHAGIDIAVHPDWHGRGIGTDAIRTLARHLIDDQGHHRLTIDPAADNETAIRVYSRIGFRPVGIMRQYERGQDGSWHDGLLMDLLATDMDSSD